MCGIALLPVSVKSAQFTSSADLPNCDLDLSVLRRRGPDISSFHLVRVPESSQSWLAVGCVLSVRGRNPTPQPIQDNLSDSSPTTMLLWNGEVFDCSSNGLSTALRNPKNNDGQLLMSWVLEDFSSENLFRKLVALRGPFAFILVRNTGHVYFGRDHLGRRSLVGRFADEFPESTGSTLHLDCLSSVVLSMLQSEVDGQKEQSWCEIPATGLFFGRILTNANGHTALGEMQLYPWSSEHLLSWEQCPKFHLNQIIPINVSSFKSHLVLTPLNLSPVEAQQGFISQLESAVSIRVLLAPTSCRNCDQKTDANSCTHARFGVLFSGGVDSTVLAFLCSRFVPKGQPIDLINVAFQQVSTTAGVQTSSGTKTVEPTDAPDRKTAFQSLDELRRLAPDRDWQLVLVDVPLDEMRRIRDGYIRQLLLPEKLTVLDESLALAMWFAARGQGWLYGAQDNRNFYTSSAKVLFLGTGIDEQLAGYSRHRKVFERGGLTALENELDLEMRRISERNLGRDDRIISDHAREARFPYLDENVISYLRQLPLYLKADLTLPRGVGDKLLLRQVAKRLGLIHAASLPKRAMQFGSRIAKAEGLGRLSGPADRLTIHTKPHLSCTNQKTLTAEFLS